MFIPRPKEKTLRRMYDLPSDPEFIATGGFKVVYKMQNHKDGAEALKAIYLPPAEEDNDQSLLFRKQLEARAKREIEALRDCDHPALVHLGAISPNVMKIDGHD